MVLLFRIVGYFVVQITQLEKFKEQAEKGGERGWFNLSNSRT